MGWFEAAVESRRVIVTIGAKTQTVAICRPENIRGTYERKFRLPAQRPITKKELERFESLAALDEWLVGAGAVVQGPPTPSVSGTPIEYGKLSVDAAGVAPDWLAEAIAVVEEEIDLLVNDFMISPYLHRVEHSVHAQLFANLSGRDLFRSRHPIGLSGQLTQLIHKEWPETLVDVASGSNRRGSFDLAILSPDQLARATLDDLTSGRIEAPIVIEMGLNYRHDHLSQDYLKLLANGARHGYLVHLSRGRGWDRQVEDFLLEESRDRAMKIAIGHWEVGRRAVKTLLDDQFRTLTS